MPEGILKTKELVGKFILLVLKQKMDSECIRYYSNIHLSYHLILSIMCLLKILNGLEVGSIMSLILTYEK